MWQFCGTFSIGFTPNQHDTTQNDTKLTPNGMRCQSDQIETRRYLENSRDTLKTSGRPHFHFVSSEYEDRFRSHPDNYMTSH